jgi:hypothetical protein
MNTIILNIPDDNDYSLLLRLLKRLGIKTETAKTASSKKMVHALEALAKKGGIKSIDNPSVWQKEVRKDRNLRSQ